MKRPIKVLWAYLLFGLFLGQPWSCGHGNSEGQTELIDYLGQTPPQAEPVVFAPGIISVEGRFDMGFTMSPDGKTMAFGVAHESDTNQNNIYFLRKSEQGWSEPTLQPLANNRNVFFPMFGPKGEQFYYARAIPGADTDIYAGSYSNGKVVDDYSLADSINSQYREAGHGLAQDGLFLFTSNRDQAQPWGGDIYTLVDSLNQTYVKKVKSLSSFYDEESLFLSPDGDYVIFQSWRPEFESKHDLYISYRTDHSDWTEPKRLPNSINSPEIEQRPFVSPDKKYLFFSRTTMKLVGMDTLFDSDIYWVSTKGLFDQ